MSHSKKVSDAVLKLRAARRANTDDAVFWLLVDPALRDPLGAAADGRQQAIISLPNVVKTMSPRLIQLHEEVDALMLQNSIQVAIDESSGLFDDETHGSPRSVCAWLRPSSGSIDLHSAANRLYMMAKLQPPELASSSVSLRFWDPRITAGAITIMSEPVWLNRLAHCGIAQWWHMDASGALIASVPDESASSPEPEFSIWRPTISQWNQLNYLSWCNRIERLAQSWDCVQPPRRLDIQPLVIRAVEAGLKFEADVICFVHACLCIDLQFDRHPAVQRALATCKATNEPGLFQAQADVWRPAVEQSATSTVGTTQ